MNAFKMYKPFEGECIRKIRLDFKVDNVMVNDLFEWDINNPDNKPEDFAKVICVDMGLGSEFEV